MSETPAAALPPPGRPSIWSARYVVPTLVVLGLALVPTVANSYVGRRVVETPPMSEALPESLDGHGSAPTARKATTIRREFASDDWAERSYAFGLDRAVTVLAVRSYDMKRLYHHPELAVTDHEYETGQVIQVQHAGTPIDVHVLPGMKMGVAAYALVYRGATVASPYLFQITVAPELLLGGQRPLTLVFAEDIGGDPSAPADQSPAVQGVVAAVAALARR